jgi:ArsR family transcriptional regulator
MELKDGVRQLEAAAEPTRLRLLVLLSGGEAMVTELQQVLAQSQPRVSRHLRLLTEAGLIDSFREGRATYYKLSPAALRTGVGIYLAGLGAGRDPVIADDRYRMQALRRNREREALRANVGTGTPADVHEALDALLGEAEPVGDVLDVGSGAGAVLRLLARRATSLVGMDNSAVMRQLARARLWGNGHCSIRDGDMHALPFAAGSFDLVVLDEVLARSPNPAKALEEARRVLRRTGRLLVIDRVRPVVRQLPGMAEAGVLFENQLLSLCAGAGLRLVRRQWLPGRAPDRALFLAVPAAAVAVVSSMTERTGTDD